MNQILVQEGDLELVVFEISVDLGGVGALLKPLHNLVNIDFLAKHYNPCIEILEDVCVFVMLLINHCLSVLLHVLFEQIDVGKGVHHLIMVDFVGQLPC